MGGRSSPPGCPPGAWRKTRRAMAGPGMLAGRAGRPPMGEGRRAIEDGEPGPGETRRASAGAKPSRMAGTGTQTAGKGNGGRWRGVPPDGGPEGWRRASADGRGGRKAGGGRTRAERGRRGRTRGHPSPDGRDGDAEGDGWRWPGPLAGGGRNPNRGRVRQSFSGCVKVFFSGRGGRDRGRETPAASKSRQGCVKGIVKVWGWEIGGKRGF